MQTRVKMVVQLILAFNYIHLNGIVHRDIKSHNVLIDENFKVKLCDFGLAKHKSELNIGSGQFSGTPAYMAPELFLKKAYDEKIDVFSFGTLIWEILVRKVPYDGYEVSEIKSKVLAEEKLFLPKIVPAQFGNIINSCRSINSSRRPSFSDLSKINFAEIKF